MKQTILLLAFILLSNWKSYGQVNDTGDEVGIGNSNPDMKLSVLTDKEYVSRFHSISTQFMTGIRIGKTKASGGSSYADLVNLSDGFGISAGYSGGNLPLNTQNKDDIAIYTNYSSRNVGIGTTSPDMKFSVVADSRSVSRFHSTSSESMTGIRIGKTTSTGSSYADLVNLSDGFGISAGHSGGNLPLNTQNEDHIAIYTNYSSRYVGIGTTEPDARLTVKGDIHTREVKVDLAGAVAPDYVFRKDYDLQTLQQVEEYIIQNSHLPEVPSAKEMEENGIELKKMNLKLLQKVEELTLYLIEQDKKINRLQDEVQELKSSK